MTGVVLLDQISKMLIVKYMEIGQSIPLISGVLNFTYITNSGAAMGLFSNCRWLFMILAPVAVVAIVVYIMVSKNVGTLYTLSLSMIAGGGIGNMIDRTFNGKFGNGVVIDFIDFCAFPNIWRYTFNVADIFVCVGSGLLILTIIIEAVRDAKTPKVENTANEANGKEENGN